MYVAEKMQRLSVMVNDLRFAKKIVYINFPIYHTEHDWLLSY